MSEARRDTIIVVGAGASGVILAAHLLRSASPSLRVTLVEKRPVFGEGIAYSTANADHLLNVTALGMSAFADDPGHFRRWVDAKGDADTAEPYYAPRGVYGQYLRDILATLAAAEPVRLRLVQQEAVSIGLAAGGGVEIALANGSSLVGHVAVLAAGHDEEPAGTTDLAVRPGSPEDTPLPSDAAVLVLGTGLSMADVVVTLEGAGHRGQAIALSRRGLMPWAHRPGRPVKLDSADIPLGTDLSYFVRWFRGLVREMERKGGDWRDVVDGLRPFNQRIWRSWPTSARRRFLEHTKAWWDIHRHRMAPAVHARLMNAIKVGRLRLLAGRLVDARPSGGGVAATIEHRGGQRRETLDVARIYDCTGIVKDVATGSIAIVRSLIEQGLARPDAMRVGVDVTEDCAVVSAAGRASASLYAVGPLTRGAFFEIDAIPDIRQQCASLARRLAP